jgi:hypothetical protein
MKRESGSTLVEILIAVVIVLAVFFGCFRGAFVDESVAVRALEKSGYSHVRITDHKWFVVGLRGCGRDAARFDAIARNPAGQEVKVFVCAGWLFKGATVRFE